MALRPGRVLLAERELAARVSALGAALGRDYQGLHPVVVGVLQGAFLFMADLVRAMPVELTTDFVALASYGAETRSSGAVRLVADLGRSIEGRHVLVVEDIVDTGLTLAYLRRLLEARGPASLRVCALIDKPARRRLDVVVDYVGFSVPDVYVVGYGFDHDGRHRNLPHVAVLEEG